MIRQNIARKGIQIETDGNLETQNPKSGNWSGNRSLVKTLPIRI